MTLRRLHSRCHLEFTRRGGPVRRGGRSEESLPVTRRSLVYTERSECALTGPPARHLPLVTRHSSLRSQRGGIIAKFLFLCAFIIFLFVLFLVRHPLMRLAGHAIIVDDSPRASDAIVMLGDDDYTADRARRAAELIKGGWAPRVVASGRYLRPYMSVTQLERRDLIADGVPASAVIPLSQHARDTREECAVIGRFLGQRGWKHVLLVTSNYHTRRADYICSRLMPRGTELYVVAAKDSDYNPNDWWDSREGVKRFFHEFVGLIVSAWEMRHNRVQTQD